MGGLKTITAALALAVSLPAPTRADDTLLRTIATCTGRFSAEVEHHWLFPTPDLDRAEARRDAMVSVLEALLPRGRGREVLSWRIEGKMAQATLLTRATFNEDGRDAQWARRQADMMLSTCSALILS